MSHHGTGGLRDTIYRATPVGNHDALCLGAWGEVFGDVVIASDDLDRLLLHYATTVSIGRKASFIKCTLITHSEA